ncbi:F-box/LRR-repeat protein At5g02910-like [Aegilops tauschii subsp. strangulata]|uniref:F-box/LRR-repeat protein At5g02910-like n=1 Tax=Aegilops tauschii subsp. strangulata TaxID=200361 RepID=UPI00098AC994|nr:uncharacterized protein LOC109777752 [Aegilops tauschii subsp. strangulata]
MDGPLSVCDDQPLPLRRGRRLRRASGVEEDRLGALPDDMLHLVLRRLDTRSALATSALSRRWASLPRELPTLEFKVRDILPRRYNQYLRRRTDAANSRQKPCGWGVEDLEVVVLNPGARHRAGYSFPHHCFADPNFPGDSVKLKKLRLSNCPPLSAGPDANPPPPLDGWPRLRGRHPACPALEVLHLRSCGCRERSFTLDAPGSRIKELLIELSGRALGMIDLRALPRLERLACMGAPLELNFGNVPRLAQLNLTYDEDANAKTLEFALLGVRNLYLLSSFLSRLTGLEDLVLRFTGPEMWVLLPLNDMPPLDKLKRLLVADVPSSWDITWIRYLLEAAPSLETLHIHVADDDDAGSAAAGDQ